MVHVPALPPVPVMGKIFVTASWEKNSHSGSVPSGECVRQERRTGWRGQICSRTPCKLQPISHTWAYTAVLNFCDPKLSCTLCHTSPFHPWCPPRTSHYLETNEERRETYFKPREVTPGRLSSALCALAEARGGLCISV